LEAISDGAVDIEGLGLGSIQAAEFRRRRPLRGREKCHLFDGEEAPERDAALASDDHHVSMV
jgi:hypothetical protein